MFSECDAVRGEFTRITVVPAFVLQRFRQGILVRPTRRSDGR
jgi:hypothetical protein